MGTMLLMSLFCTQCTAATRENRCQSAHPWPVHNCLPPCSPKLPLQAGTTSSQRSRQSGSGLNRTVASMINALKTVHPGPMTDFHVIPFHLPLTCSGGGAARRRTGLPCD
uniref:Putative secreted protein n=1 Tax=Ixodes ricinus TaxID=34613 RepID=A0A6B0UJ52_IXORI